MIIVDRLLTHPTYLHALDAIERKEETRRFCRHGLDHFLDVARISWIICLEHGRDFDKETVYLAALLHDIGRSQGDAHHDAASVAMARTLLADCGADAACIRAVCDAIAVHRRKDDSIAPGTASLGDILAHADKLSRPCFRCAAAADCYWPATVKNATIYY
ncbi:MAG: HD domain-containing protein [Peptococcaceae bacterium]|nr:HD domain-containing protein [Peptococcaceae bacterium]